MNLKEKLETALKVIDIVNPDIDDPSVKGSTTISFALNSNEEKLLQEYLESHRSLGVSGYGIYITRPTQYYPKWLANFHRC